MEQKVLAAVLQSRKVWDLLQDELNPKDLSPEGELIYGLIKEFYDNDTGAHRCDADILSARAERSITSNKLVPTIVGAIRDFSKQDISAVNVGMELVEVKRSVLGNKIASQLASQRPSSNVKELMSEYARLDDKLEVGEGSESEEFIGAKAVDLAQTSFNKKGLIPLYPLALNDQIDGGLRPGHHVLIFAPTEMGKSLFAINACYGFLRHGFPPLYCGNEDPAPDVLLRMMTRLTGMTKYQILEDPGSCDALLAKRSWDKFVFANLSPGTYPKIHGLIEKYQPKVVVLDQLRNIDVQTDNRTQALEKAATEARNLAKRYGVAVLSVTQAADSASGKAILSRGDVDGSNIGIPGQTDLMIGMGATEEMEERGMRTLSLVKNKLSGNHAPIQIQIDPFTSRIIENG